MISGGSICPFVPNILLAARNEGYGGTPTTSLPDKRHSMRFSACRDRWRSAHDSDGEAGRGGSTS